MHRRDEFRGNADTIKDCDLQLFLSYVPKCLSENTVTLQSVKTNETIDLSYDYILVNFGQLVNKTTFEAADNIYYIGDVTGSKTIAEGIEAADNLFKQLF